MTQPNPRIVYCRCAYAQVVPQSAKDGVLERLCESGLPFESVSDLCEMAARRDPLLAEVAGQGPVRIAACYPRAVKWLFHQSGVDLPDDPAAVRVINMRNLEAEEAFNQLTTADPPQLPSAD